MDGEAAAGPNSTLIAFPVLGVDGNPARARGRQKQQRGECEMKAFLIFSECCSRLEAVLATNIWRLLADWGEAYARCVAVRR